MFLVPPFYQAHHSKTHTAQTPLSCRSKDESSDKIPPNLLSTTMRNTALSLTPACRQLCPIGKITRNKRITCPKLETLETIAPLEEMGQSGMAGKDRGVRVHLSGSGNLVKNKADGGGGESRGKLQGLWSRRSDAPGAGSGLPGRHRSPGGFLLEGLEGQGRA